MSRVCVSSAFCAVVGLFVTVIAHASTAVGFTPGQFSVDPTGTANYRIGIKVPPGVHGMQPDLALIYSSRAGNNQLGVGWSLSGLSVITRCAQTKDQDQNIHLPNLSTDDRFCLDGKRLMVSPTTSANYWSSSGSYQYRTEIASFQKVSATGVAGNGPVSFTVQDKTGLTRSYGTVSSRIGYDNQTMLNWPIDKIQDAFGNYINYIYGQVCAPGEYLLTEIDYGSSAGRVGKVVFRYQQTGSSGCAQERPDNEFDVVAGTPVSTTQRLDSVLVYGPGNNLLVRQYNLGYMVSNRTNRSLLSSVQECDPSGACLPATTFNWTSIQSPVFDARQPYNIIATTGAFRTLDLDGDGLPDYVSDLNGQLQVVLGNSMTAVHTTGIYTTSRNLDLQHALVLDFHGDGHQELLIPKLSASGSGEYFALYGWVSPSAPLQSMDDGPGITGTCPDIEDGGDPGLGLEKGYGCYPTGSYTGALAMDLDGDGRPELLIKSMGTDSQNNPAQTLHFFENSSTGWKTTLIDTHIPAADDQPLMPLNFAGSGHPDIYIPPDCPQYTCLGGTYSWYPASNSAGYTYVFTGSGNFGAGNVVVFMDANGDGLSDAVVEDAADSQWCIYTNEGGSWSPIPGSIGPSNMPNCTPVSMDYTNEAQFAQATDYYGDGHQDLMLPINGKWYVLKPESVPNLATKQIYLDNPAQTDAPFGRSAGGEFIDANGDGQVDYAYRFGSGLGVMYNHLQMPELVNQIRTLNDAGVPIGQQTNIGYLPLTIANVNSYVIPDAPLNIGSHNAPHVRAYMGPLYVVIDYAIDSGTSLAAPNWIYTYYRYGGAAIDQYGRGFLGFSDMQVINANTGIYTENTYDQEFPYTGMVTMAQQISIKPGQQVTIANGNNPITQFDCTPTTTGEPICHSTTSPLHDVASFNSAALGNGRLITKTVSTEPTTAQSITLTKGGVFPYFKSTTQEFHELTGSTVAFKTVTTTYSYILDSTGDDAEAQGVTVETTTPGGDDYIVDTQSTYQNYIGSGAPGYWCLGRVKSITVTDTWDGAVYPAKVSNFDYDSCQLKQESSADVAPPDLPGFASFTGNNLTKVYGYDAFGNHISTTITGSGLPQCGTGGCVTTTGYDKYHLYPVSVTNPLGQAVLSTYDNRFGTQASETDPNGLAVSTVYDSFGKKSSEQGVRAAQQTQTQYYWCGSGYTCLSSNAVYAVKAMMNSLSSPGTFITASVTEYDSLARPVFTVHYGLNGKVDNQATYYDSLGRTYLTSRPYLSGAANICWDYKVYDVLGRPVNDSQPAHDTECQGTSVPAPVADPAGAPPSSFDLSGYTSNTSDSYVGLTTITDHAGHQATTVLNGMGKAQSTVDPYGNATTFTYDPWGNSVSVTDVTGQNVTRMYVDSGGHKLAMVDPDMGQWAYSYDGLGELTGQVSPNERNNGQSTLLKYDALGRLVERDEPEGVTNWVYDISYGAGIGNLAYIKDGTGYWEGYAYDAYGSPTDKISIINGQEYWVTTTYTDQGQPAEVVYPDMAGINANVTPAQPAGLTAGPDPDNGAVIDVRWSNTANAGTGAVYHLFRTDGNATDPSNGQELYAGPDVVTFPDAGITDNGTYKWWLQACNGTTCSAPASVTAYVTLPPTVPGTPDMPADNHHRTVNFSWPASSLVSTTAGPITYVVEETLPNNSKVQFSATDPTNAATSVLLSVDGLYSFRVRSVAGGANSAWSGSATYNTVLTPGAPASITAPASETPSAQSITYTVNWTVPTFTGGPVTYTLQEEDQTDANPSFTTIYSGTGLSKSVTRSKDGLYLYQVQACDQADTSVCSGFVQASAPTAVTLAPSNPGYPMVPGADLHALLWPVTWAVSDLAGIGSQATAPSYQLQESYNSGGFTLDSNGITISGSIATEYVTPQVVGNYYQDGTYTYRVRACNHDPATGGTACTDYQTNAAASAYTTIVTPGTPSSITAPSTSNGDGSFTVTYTAPPAGSGGTISKYQVQLGINDPETGSIDWSYGFCTSANTTCTFAANSNVGTYHIQVVACGNGMTVCSAGKAASHQITIALSPPPAPVLSASPKFINAGDSTTVSWTNPGGSVSSYNLQVETTTSFHTIYSGTARSRTYSPAASDNWYRVQACNASGCGAWSNTVDVIVNGGTCNNCSAGIGKPASPLPASDDGHLSAYAAAFSWHGAAKVAGLEIRYRPETLTATLMPAHRSLEPVTGPHMSIIKATSRTPAAVRTFAAAGLGVKGKVSAKGLAVAAYPHPIESTRPPVHSPRVVPDPVLDRYATRIVPVDPKLSLYPPLRRDARVQRHYTQQGGLMPQSLRRASDSDDEQCSDQGCTDPDDSAALEVAYGYDSRGNLMEVDKVGLDGNPSVRYWVASDTNAYGQVVSAGLNVGLTSNLAAMVVQRQFDGATGQVTCIDAYAAGAQASGCQGSAPAGTLQYASYSWDVFGNLKTRADLVTGLNETFDYDLLNRVTGITTQVNASTVSSDAPTYYDNGNIWTRAGGNYSYPSPGSPRPHAVSSVDLPNGGGTWSFSYDADGNLKTGGPITRVDWTSYDKPSLVQANGATESFTYDPDRSKIMRVDQKPGGGTVTTVYVGGFFEVESDSGTGITTYRHYIMAGAQAVAVDSFSGTSGGQPTENVTYLFHDNLDSVEVTSDSSGQNVQRYSYDAWGKARPTTGANAYLSPGWGQCMATLAGRHTGFDGHENLDDECLVHMEGRIYMPDLGRFMSPDPNVPYPENGQSYNRYSYVQNNPLSATDPSGYYDLQSFVHTVAEIAPIIPGCNIVCVAVAQAVDGYMQTGSLQAGIQAGVTSIAYAAVANTVGGLFGADSTQLTAGQLLEQSIAEGIVGGLSSELGGGRFGDGFINSFVGNYAQTAFANIKKVILAGLTKKVGRATFSDGALGAAVGDAVGADQDDENPNGIGGLGATADRFYSSDLGTLLYSDEIMSDQLSDCGCLKLTSTIGTDRGTNSQGEPLYHPGYDYATSLHGIPRTDANALSVTYGIVRRIGADGFGKYAVAVETPEGHMAIYGHLAKNFVQEGDLVYPGMKLGIIGNEGLSSGIHLHFEMRTGYEPYTGRFMGVRLYDPFVSHIDWP